MEVLPRRRILVFLSIFVIENAREVVTQGSEVSAKYRAARVPGYAAVSPPKHGTGTKKVSGFVIANGTDFYVDGKPLYFAGTNAYYLAARNLATDSDIQTFFQTNANNGVNVIRIFAFVNGFGNENSTGTPDPIQPHVGVYNEAGLQRLDYILMTAANYGQRVILTLVNYEDELGGMQWYVDEVLGKGHLKEEFYTNPSVRDAFKGYVRTILERVNTMTGMKYKDDPVIFSVELANEPHTSDNYEQNLGGQPGDIVRDWISDMSDYVRSIDTKHMISTGEEGYRVDGPNVTDHLTWLNNGTKGVDYSANILGGNISFATVHVYPDNWNVPPQELAQVQDFIADRAKIAHDAGKPFVVEEYGMQSGYMKSRQDLLSSIQDAANDADAAATLVWQVYAWPIESHDTYNFDWSQPGNEALRTQIELMKEKTNGTYGMPSNSNLVTPSVSAPGCSDLPPPSDTNISCHERATVLRQCDEAWMRGFCRASCGTCIVAVPVPAPNCSDVPPPSTENYTCHQQANVFNKCGETWMARYCDKSCGRCDGSPAVGVPAPIPQTATSNASCTDIPPDDKYSCFQQAVLFRQCRQPWMKGHCLASCNACPLPAAPPAILPPAPAPGPPLSGPPSAETPLPPSPEQHCTDEAPSKAFSCFQQAVLWRKCNEPWMKDKCNMSCGRCGRAPCTDVPPPSAMNYTCHQQASIFKHCGEAWMEGYCQASCGICSTGSETGSPSPAPAPAPGVKQQSNPAPASIPLAAHAFADPIPLIGYPVPVPPAPAPAVAPSPPATQEPGPKFKLPCTDEAPPSKHKYSCLQQAILWKKCGEPWMANYCHASCGRCTSVQPAVVLDIVPALATPAVGSPDSAEPCVDIAPPLAIAFKCEDQSSVWNQCDEAWMKGYCLRSCGRCHHKAAKQ